MGLFDEIRCDVPLPDGYDSGGGWFQSKSFPDCFMCRYIMTSAGRLVDAAGNDLEPEGYLNFYTLDPPSEDSTDSDSRWREYRACFVSGQLQNIVRVPNNETESRYYGLASYRLFNSPSFLFGDPDEDGGNGNADDA